MSRSLSVGKTVVIALVVLVAAMVFVGPLTGTAGATSGSPNGSGNGTASASSITPAVVSGSGSSDATAALSKGGTLSWSLSPSAAPTLVTLSCAAWGTGVVLWATYGSSWMSSAINYSYNGLYVGIFYLNYPASGTQTAVVTLYGASGTTTLVECSASGWTGTAGVDPTLWGRNWEWGNSQAYVSINPSRAVPSGEVFLSALSRLQWGTSGTALSVTGSPSGVGASIVDSNTNTGIGLGYGCQAEGSSDVDCIASAQLGSGGTSMQYSWTYGAFAIVAGIGIEMATLTYWAPGYALNSLYMTEGLSNTNNPLFILPKQSMWLGASQSASQQSVGVANALNLSVGQDQKTPQTPNVVFAENWNGNQNFMDIYIPVAAAGGSKGGGYNGAPDVVDCMAYSLGISGVGPKTATDILWVYDTGINATGPNVATSPTKSQYLINLGIDALGFLPGVGWGVGTYQTMNDLEGVIGTATPTQQLQTNGGATATLLFNIVGGTNDIYGDQVQNVYNAQSIFHIMVDPSDFSNTPQLTFTAQNLVNGPGPGGCGTTSPYPGVSTGNLIMGAYPAGAIQGTVYIDGSTKVAPAVITAYQLSPGTGHGLTIREYNSGLGSPTNGYGQYAFAGNPGGTYNFFATYQTPFGPVSSPTYTVTAPGTPYCSPSGPSCVTTLDLWTGASVITGTVTYNGNPFPNALVYVLSPSGALQSALANGNGVYSMQVNAPGTYQVSASGGSGYGSQLYPVPVAMNKTFNQPIQMSYTPPPPRGCVLAGTNITTLNGKQTLVEKLSQGDSVLGYNVTSGTWVKEGVTTNSATTVNEILSINNGLLDTTVTDQPLYVRNGTWVGWVHDPENLKVGEQIYDPLTASWTTITSLQVQSGTFTVYDLRLTAQNDFVANGLLALDKIG